MQNSSFKEMMKNRGQGIQQVQSKVESTSKTSYIDERIWAPKPDKSGNFTGIIRFLPAPANESSPYTERFSHGFKDDKTGKWLIENCPTTIGRQCPICDANSELWNTGVEANQNISRKRKRQLSYYTNIVVVKDPNNPENEGKVFIYRFGKKIFEKILAKVDPNDAEIETPVDIFDFIEGADFVIKMKRKGGFANYDDSYFKETSELLDGDVKALEELWNTQYSLEAFVDESEFKSYDELKERLDSVTGKAGSSPTNRTAEEALGDSSNEEEVEENTEAPFKPTKQTAEPSGEEEQDPMSFFEGLED